MAGTWRMDRAGWIVAAAAVVAALLAPAPSMAARADSSVSISSRVPAFHGRVSSPNASCRKGRKVKLYERSGGSGRKKLGSDRSDGGGRWEIPLDDVDPGAYLVKVSGTRDCRGARSEPIVVG